MGEGLRILTAAVGAPDALNTCRDVVRPGVIQALIDEAGITPLQVVRGSITELAVTPQVVSLLSQDRARSGVTLRRQSHPDYVV